MHLVVLTPERKVFDGEVNSVTLPGSKEKGSFQILEGHAPITSTLTKGKLTIKSNGDTTHYLIQSGFVEASDNDIAVMVESVQGNYKPEDIK